MLYRLRRESARRAGCSRAILDAVATGRRQMRAERNRAVDRSRSHTRDPGAAEARRTERR